MVVDYGSRKCSVIGLCGSELVSEVATVLFITGVTTTRDVSNQGFEK